jgi:hypothetical protein
MNKMLVSYENNNIFLITMLLKIIKPNIDKFMINEKLLSFTNLQTNQ